MTTRYEYKCDQCDANYVEQRRDTESQFITVCDACKTGTYTEVTATYIEPDGLLVAPLVVDEVPAE